MASGYYQRKVSNEEFIKDPKKYLSDLGFKLESNWDDPFYSFSKEYKSGKVMVVVSESKVLDVFSREYVRYIRFEWNSKESLKEALGELELKLYKIEEVIDS